MARKKIKFATDQRPFAIVYHDFFKSSSLNLYEKMTFIALKIFADNNNQCFPSIKTLAKLTNISEKKMRITLTELEKKGVITKENRTRSDGGKSSNLYTLHDYAEIWNAESDKEVLTAINKYEEMKLVLELRARGYTVTKEKEPECEPVKAHIQAQLNKFLIDNNNTAELTKSQELERYTLDQIHQLFDYDIMIQDDPYKQQDIDSVMDILYTTMNTTKKTIKIAGEDKPAMVVIGKLMKLNKDSIMYTIEKFSEQIERIKNPISYMLTMLYNAPEQFNLDIQNQVSYNMAHWNEK